MTFSLQSSGGVENALASLAQQAAAYADPVVKHVVDFISTTVEHLDTPHGVTISASGHGHSGQIYLNLTMNPLGEQAAPPAPETPTEPPTQAPPAQ